jgi:23S rRNA (pseudouridine1915-N3)-methyltransferase
VEVREANGTVRADRTRPQSKAQTGAERGEEARLESQPRISRIVKGNEKLIRGDSRKSVARFRLDGISVKIKIAWIGKTKEPAIQSLTNEYLNRLARYADTEGIALKDEAALLKRRGRDTLVLLDSRGKQLSSEEFGEFLGNHQDRNPLPLLFAVGPASGFTAETRQEASLLLSLGKMTLAHELARVVLLEQLYRAFTILKGHPYHLGH